MSGRPFVILAFRYPDGYAFSLDPEHARVVGSMLVSVGRNHLEAGARLHG